MAARRRRKGKKILARARCAGSTWRVDYLSLIARTKLHYKRSDVTPIFAEPAAFRALGEDLVAPWANETGSQKLERVN